MKTNTRLAPVGKFGDQCSAGRQLAIDAYVHWRSQRPERHEMTAHLLAAGLLESMEGASYEEREQLLAFVLSELLETID